MAPVVVVVVEFVLQVVPIVVAVREVVVTAVQPFIVVVSVGLVALASRRSWLATP